MTTKKSNNNDDDDDYLVYHLHLTAEYWSKVVALALALG